MDYNKTTLLQDTSNRGLRGQIILALSVALIPAALIACVWIYIQSQRLYDVKLNAAARTADHIAANISAIFYDATTTAATYFPPDDEHLMETGLCQARLSEILHEKREYSFVALYANKHLICYKDVGGYLKDQTDTSSDIALIRHRLKEQQDGTINPVVLHAHDAKHILLGISVLPDESEKTIDVHDIFLIAALRIDILSHTISTKRLGIERATALVSAQGDIIAEASHSHDIPKDWYPQGLKPDKGKQKPLTPDSNFSGISQSGKPFYYFTSPTINPDIFILTGYPNTQLFASERRIIWGAMLPPLIMLAISCIGALWVTEHLVMRWIKYLQRVTRLYGSGRMSVRALHIHNAPREIAELGHSFNKMAANIAEHSYRCEQDAHEKAKLLRELHHRVKNSFQIIASLFNLHKQINVNTQNASLQEIETTGLRLLEDHIQAMSVAYQISYSTGGMGEAPLGDLLQNVIECMCKNSSLQNDDIITAPLSTDYTIDLDQAVGIALYIATVLSSYLDVVKEFKANNSSAKIMINTNVINIPEENVSEENALQNMSPYLKLYIGINPLQSVTLSALQKRLTQGYVRQLNASLNNNNESLGHTILIPLMHNSVN